MRNAVCSLLICGLVFGSLGLAQSKNPTKTTVPRIQSAEPEKPLITFVEIGSVKCIPCKAMQPVMKAIEAKYGAQVRIVFYDVWTKEQAHYAQDYKIRLIPTQVFLDASGKELMRHEGFFPEKAIDDFLQSKGLRPKVGEKG
jgi:thioredoxin 1